MPTAAARRKRVSDVDFTHSEKVTRLSRQLDDFMQAHVFPAEPTYAAQLAEHRAAGDPWRSPRVMDELKAHARAAGLWNLFLPQSEHGGGLSNVEYAPLCELMGRSPIGPETFNCSAPDTGNMELLERYGTQEQKERWLEPLLAGEIRSAFAMTEPAVASSDATNIESSIARDGDGYVLNGRKWFISGANDRRCKLIIFMGKSDPDNADRHRQQSMLLVPADAPGVRVLRHLPVFGYDDAPHGHAEIVFENVRVARAAMLVGEGHGFSIAQGRLGPGRIHHCMRAIGLAERMLTLACRRATQRVAFGRPIAQQTVTMERIANSRILIDQARLLVLHAAHLMDTVGNKGAAKEIAMIKVAAPQMACQVIDWAIQVHGGGGVSEDFPLAYAYAQARTLRLVDGPDEVHRNQVARIELGQQLAPEHA
ncbi:MAG TPA: acyl-CoA dehydrogenase family protein [Steroidobacteraceae bacterium]|nr:acyl-CoA dehydrogenase family protein [Steroidobacteraceae bacterium]